jgi:hypothetical protein
VTTPEPVDQSDKIGVYLAEALQRVRAIKQRLQSNEGRLRVLEGEKDEGPATWTVTRERAELLIGAIAAVEISGSLFDSTGARVGPTGQLLEAMPGFDENDLVAIAERGESAQFGAINMVQGYLGEEAALNAINSGLVPAPEGRLATFPDAPNQPGHDLQFVGADGQAPILAQVKFTESASVIREHFQKYPEVNVVYANSEAAMALRGDPSIQVLQPGDAFPSDGGRYVVDLGMSKDEIRERASLMVEGATEASFLDQLMDNIPVISLLAIGGAAAKAYLDSDADTKDILRAARTSALRVITASGTGTVGTAATSEPIVGSVVAVGTLVGGAALSQARNDLRLSTDRLRRIGSILQRMRSSQSGTGSPVFGSA